MKKNIVIIFCGATIFAACNGGEKKTSITTTMDSPKTETKPAEPVRDCYAGKRGKDTVTLSYMINDNVVTGELMYNYFEKDKNTGTIKGKFSGDTLFADYNFKSEGMMSVREVVFVKKGNTLVEGYGDGEEKDGKWVFKKKDALKFDNSIVLDKVVCN